jgi:hypothetical protein
MDSHEACARMMRNMDGAPAHAALQQAKHWPRRCKTHSVGDRRQQHVAVSLLTNSDWDQRLRARFRPKSLLTAADLALIPLRVPEALGDLPGPPARAPIFALLVRVPERTVDTDGQRQRVRRPTADRSSLDE